jgi:filamin
MSSFSSDKYAVRFIPRENGIYLIDVKFNGTHIPGSPFKIRVGEPGHGGDPGLVSAYGAGLEGGVTGRSMGATLSMNAAARALISQAFGDNRRHVKVTNLC